ncbi:GMC oxidoreductase [Apiospora kogelbergensis]|uniref:GMC oxidoreductase n=1 Tax=Apiospora kogelbergensis TaxID=1337665 RepID=UPI00312DBDDF
MSISRSSLLVALAVSCAHSFTIPRSAHHARQVKDVSELLPAYDYIFVGGGTSALTVADRLTEDAPDLTVLVLEAGPFADPASYLPVAGGGPSLTGGSPTQPVYNFTSAPQENLDGQSYDIILGNMVGGSSGVNSMMNLRGSAEDYDRWGQLFENDEVGWNWEGILPYFKKALNFSPPPQEVADRFNITYDASYWGSESRVHAAWPTFQYPGLDPLVAAFDEMPGVEHVADSGAGGAGVYWFPTLMDPIKHERSFALNGHYENLDRPNYHIMAEATVRRIMLEGSTATTVEFQTGKDKGVSTTKAKKEIIMAAGACSGIGPKKVLEAAGIETIIDLPGVGQNFQDHPTLVTNITHKGLLDIHPNGFDIPNNSSFRDWALEAWETDRSGPFSLGIENVAAWLPLTAVAPSLFESWATELETQEHASYLPEDTHPTVAAGYAAQMQGLAAVMRSKDTVWTRFKVNGTLGPTNPILNQPLSRGSVNIDAADPFGKPPVVNYRTLSNPVEIKILTEMLKWVRKYSFETSLKNLGPVESMPGPDVVTDEHIAKYLTHGGGALPSDYHPAGTTAMMPLELGGVVDQTLRVYGVKSLRIIDTGIMPNLPGANTCQPTYGMAEKAADIIKSNI